jgi:hypothetical protein
MAERQPPSHIAPSPIEPDPPGFADREPERPASDSHEEGHRCLEWCPICRAADVLRAADGPDLGDQWHTVQREALLTMRTLIDQYLQRLDADQGDAGARVEDIPLD